MLRHETGQWYEGVSGNTAGWFQTEDDLRAVVIWDDAELSAMQSSQHRRRAPVRLWSGRDAQVYDFEFPTQCTDSSLLDGSVRPKYQFHLEVERVVLPANAPSLGNAMSTLAPFWV